MQRLFFLTIVAALTVFSVACENERPSDERGQQVGYRSGTVDDDFTSNGERGNFLITEINWAGSVRVDEDGQRVHDPKDIFIELQNKHPRPVNIEGWQLIISAGTGDPNIDRALGRNERPRRTYIIPKRTSLPDSGPLEGCPFSGEISADCAPLIQAMQAGERDSIPPSCDCSREHRQPVESNEFIVIAVSPDGAFANADYFIEDLVLPLDNFQITLRDLDDRLIEPAGSTLTRTFAGSYDLVSVRSMERIQLIFSNRGTRESAWHSYSLSRFGSAEEVALHEDINSEIAPEYKEFTLASPGKGNSPDYSGNTSSGDFQ